MQASVSYRYILRTSAPIALALLIPIISNLTNNYFLGKLGERELAVNGVAGIYYLILAMIGYGLANGVQIQFSRRAAQQDHHGIARLLTNGGMFTVFLALSLMIASMWFAPLIFGFSLHNAEHVYLSISFLFIRVWGLPFLMLTQLANAFYISTGRSTYLLWGSLTATSLNIFLDYGFILGHFGFPAMGLNGAALASVLAEMGGWGVMWLLFYLRKLHIRFPIFEHLSLDLRLIRRMVRVALPLVVQYFFSIAGWQVFFIFVEHLGERELAASQILRPTFGVLGTTTMAFATTCNMSVSNIIGQGRSRDVPRLIFKIIVLSFGTGVLLCSVLLMNATGYLRLFTSDESLVTLALPSLYIITSATLMMSIASVLFNGVIGTGNTNVNLLIEIICVGCYLLYCYFIIERARMGLAWAWGSEFVYWTALLICGFSYLRSGRWKGKVI